MKKEQMLKVEKDTIYLINCGLHNIKPDEKRVEKMNLKKVYKLSKFHSIEALVYIGLQGITDYLQKSEISQETKDLLKKWRKKKEQILRSIILMDIEREEILKTMEEKGIWYMPLKGILIRDMYPSPEARQMADNDILFDKSFDRDVYNIMMERGYEATDVGRTNEDLYLKHPVYNFEMHKDLFGVKHDIKWQEYYKDIKDMLIKDDDKEYGYHFKDEDFYVYYTIHAYNHYIRRGTGLRTVIDYYLYVKEKGQSLDWNYIEEQLDFLGGKDFEKEIRSLSRKVFDKDIKDEDRKLTASEKEMLDYIIFAGTFGTEENHLDYKLKEMQKDGDKLSKNTKAKYLFKRIVPDMEFYQRFYPIAYKHKWLVPFVMIYRIFKAIFAKPKMMLKELKSVIKK